MLSICYVPGSLPGSLKYFIKFYSNSLRKVLYILILYNRKHILFLWDSNRGYTPVCLGYHSRQQKKTDIFQSWWCTSRLSRILFFSVSSFQRGFPLGGTILVAVGRSLHLERNSSWVEGILWTVHRAWGRNV